MIFAYPCILTPDEQGYLATFPDIPEAGTGGDDRDDSLARAADALAVALAGYVHAKRDIPAPSPLHSEQVDTSKNLQPLLAGRKTAFENRRILQYLRIAGRVPRANIKKFDAPDDGD